MAVESGEEGRFGRREVATAVPEERRRSMMVMMIRVGSSKDGKSRPRDQRDAAVAGGRDGGRDGHQRLL